MTTRPWKFLFLILAVPVAHERPGTAWWFLSVVG